MNKISVFILAAGSSTRFGSQKLLEKINDKYLCEYCFSMCKGLNLDTTVVYKDKMVGLIAKEYGFKTLRNDGKVAGKARSIQLAAQHSKGGMLFLQADQPFISPRTIAEMQGLYAKDKIVRCYTNGIPSSPVLFGESFAFLLQKLSGDKGGSALLELHKNDVLQIQIDPLQAVDIDTKEQLAFYENFF